VELGECAEQAVQVLVRMESGNRQQKGLWAGAADGEELRATPCGATRTFESGRR